MTGRFASHTGIGPNVIRPVAPYAVPKDEVLLPELLKKQGYATAAVGKWQYVNTCRTGEMLALAALHSCMPIVFCFMLHIVSAIVMNATLRCTVDSTHSSAI